MADENNEETTAQTLPFGFALLKVRVNSKWIQRLTAAGIRTVRRNPARELAVQAKHKEQRGERHYLRLGKRTNAADQEKGDSGIKRIGFNEHFPLQGNPADPAKAARVDKVFEDLIAAGYVMSDIHILKRDGEKRGMGFLVIVFQEGVEDFVAEESCLQVLENLFGRYYRSVWVWENPDGSATINANMAIVGNDLEQVTDSRAIRFAYIQGEDKTRWASRKIAKNADFIRFVSANAA